MKAHEIGAYAAKTHLSRILEEVRRGRTFYITRRGRRLAELRPVPGDAGRPSFGCDRGRVAVARDFDDPIPGIIAQGLCEKMPIVSGDPAFDAYGARVVR